MNANGTIKHIARSPPMDINTDREDRVRAAVANTARQIVSSDSRMDDSKQMCTGSV